MNDSTIAIYERLAVIFNAQTARATQLAIQYLTSEDEADRREAIARFEMVKELETLMTCISIDQPPQK